MPLELKRRLRQSLRLDHGSRQVLASKLNFMTSNALSTPFPKSPISCHPPPSPARSRSQVSYRSRRRARSSHRTSASEIRRARSASSGQRIPGALLPAELLLHVFALGSLHDHEFPVTVSQVCSYWRRLSVRTPGLWCHVCPDRRRRLTSRRIQRSRGLPLNIDLDLRPVLLTKAQMTLADIHMRMHSIIPAVKQWRSLSIHFTGFMPYFWNAALSELCPRLPSPSSHAPQLECLSLIYPSNDDTKEFLLFGGHAPNLRDVTVDGLRLRWTASLFENLTRLDYHHHAFTSGHEAVAEALVILRVSCQLRVLVISFPGRHAEDASFSWTSQAYTPISLGDLEQLTLRVVGDNIPRELTVLASKVVVPRLRRLRLASNKNALRFSGREVSAVLGSLRCHQNLDSVVVEHAWAHGRSLSTFLRSLPNVRRISARGHRVTDEFLSLLLKPVDQSRTPERRITKTYALGGIESLNLLDASVTTDLLLTALINTPSTTSFRAINCYNVSQSRLLPCHGTRLFVRRMGGYCREDITYSVLFT